MNKESRKIEILATIIDRFLEFGEPVGSKTISQLLKNRISPATIRNEMVELAISGYLVKPHISSGRVPSIRGYRFYVDKLLDRNRLTFEEEELIDESLFESMFEPEKFMKRTTGLLSRLTVSTAFSVTRPNINTKITEIRIVQIGIAEAILILRVDCGMTKSLIFKSSYVLTPGILKIFQEILAKKFCGLSLKVLSEKFEEMVADLTSDTTRLIMPIIKALVSASKQASEVEVETAGRNNLLRFSGVNREAAVKIFDILDNSESMGEIFFDNGYLIGHDITLFIGDENPKPEFRSTTLAVTGFSFGGKNGVLGIICPVPTDFSRVISVMSHISKAIRKVADF